MWQVPREYLKQSAAGCQRQMNQDALPESLALELGVTGCMEGFPLTEILEGGKELV